MTVSANPNDNGVYKKNLALRKRASLAVLFVYLIIGLPVWYHLTKVDQYELSPLMDGEKIKTAYLFEENYTDKDFLNGIGLRVPVNLNLTRTFYKFPDLLESTQKELNNALERYRSDYGFNNLDFSIELKEVGEETPEFFYDNNEYLVQLEHNDFMGTSIHLYEKLELIVQYDDRSVYNNYLPTLISTSILDYFFFDEINEANDDRTLNLENDISSLKYTPKVKLVLNLVINDNILADWDLGHPSTSPLVQNLLMPYVKLFEGIYSFDIETNIVYNEDLNLKNWTGDNDDIDNLKLQLEVSRLTANNFVDPLEETILNFVVVFPENENLQANGSTTSENSPFLSYKLPGWGSVFIFRDLLSNYESDVESVYLNAAFLEPIFFSFLKQSFPILTGSEGEEEPVTFAISNYVKKAILSNVYRTNNNIKAVYDMVHKLPVVTDESLNQMIPEELQPYVESFMNKFFPSLSIPQKINDQLVSVIAKRDALLKNLSMDGNTNAKFSNYLKESFEFYRLSEDTFFDNEMTMGNYKSIKHIIAVYLPLLGPVFSITIGGAVQLLRKPRTDPLLKIKQEK